MKIRACLSLFALLVWSISTPSHASGSASTYSMPSWATAGQAFTIQDAYGVWGSDPYPGFPLWQYSGTWSINTTISNSVLSVTGSTNFSFSLTNNESAGGKPSYRMVLGSPGVYSVTQTGQYAATECIGGSCSFTSGITTQVPLISTFTVSAPTGGQGSNPGNPLTPEFDPNIPDYYLPDHANPGDKFKFRRPDYGNAGGGVIGLVGDSPTYASLGAGDEYVVSVAEGGALISGIVLASLPPNGMSFVDGLGVSQKISAGLVYDFATPMRSIHFVGDPQDLVVGFLFATNDASQIGDLYEYSWSAGAVPEPETYAMMLAGLGLLGFMARRRKHA